jgi:hypothetical protein
MENLGKLGRDKITGFEGIIVGKGTFLFGCNTYSLAPKAKDGVFHESHTFDVGRIEIIGEGITAEEVKSEKPGGEGLNSLGNRVL